MHDWGCMGLIFITFPPQSEVYVQGKGGLLIEGKTGLQGRKEEGVALECFWMVSLCSIWIFWHLMLSHNYLPKTPTSCEGVSCETAPDVSLWKKRSNLYWVKLHLIFLLLNFVTLMGDVTFLHNQIRGSHIGADSFSLPTLVPLFWQVESVQPSSRWASSFRLYSTDSLQCHVLERALTINSIPRFVERLCCLHCLDRCPQSSVNKMEMSVWGSRWTTEYYSHSHICLFKHLTVQHRGPYVVLGNFQHIRGFRSVSQWEVFWFMNSFGLCGFIHN